MDAAATYRKRRALGSPSQDAMAGAVLFVTAAGELCLMGDPDTADQPSGPMVAMCERTTLLCILLDVPQARTTLLCILLYVPQAVLLALPMAALLALLVGTHIVVVVGRRR